MFIQDLFKIYSMFIQDLFKIYSMFIQCSFKIYSRFIQNLGMGNMLVVRVTSCELQVASATSELLVTLRVDMRVANNFAL